MIKLENISIKNKLILMILGVSVVSLMLGFGYELYKGVKNLKKEMLEYSKIQTQMIADYCVVPLTFESKDGIDQVLSKLENTDLIQSAIVYDINGTVFTYYSKTDKEFNLPFYNQKLENKFYNEYLQIIEPIEHNNNYYGELVVNFSTTPLKDKTQEIIIEITISLFTLVILSLLMANYLQNYFSRPILELAHITENISSFGDYKNFTKTERKDEIGRLYNSFNNMMRQLEDNENKIHHYNEQLLRSLNEKEVLLKEIHHRVKNNLQIIISLLNLQITNSHNIEAQKTLTDCKNRVFSMSIVHEKLYQSTDLAQIDFKAYINSLILHYKSIYEKNRKVSIINRVSDISFDINYAIPLGLIINELISNSYKHAFPQQDNGEILISLENDNNNHYILNYQDNGIGFPENMKNLSRSSLGITLIFNLVKQLEANIQFKGPGARVFIDFHTKK